MEGPARVGAERLVDGVSEGEAVVENRDTGLLGGDHVPVHGGEDTHGQTLKRMRQVGAARLAER